MSDNAEIIEKLEQQERALVFSGFTEETAFDLGIALVEAAKADSAAVVIDIRTPDRTLFHVALPGSASDNDEWARRKSNLVFRRHRSSWRAAENLAARSQVIGLDLGMDPRDYAAKGGSFPIRVESVGVVAAVTVSGLASADDHALVVTTLAAFLGVSVSL